MQLFLNYKTMLEKIQKLCDGIEYSRDIPKEVEALAKENGIIVIVGGSDDLMYCYGADSYLTDQVEHGVGEGEDLTIYEYDKSLRKEAKQLGLKIWWCGEIKSSGERKPKYSTAESGGFSYSVNPDIEHLEFKVLEDAGTDYEDVYCTGIIIKLPENFKSYK